MNILFSASTQQTRLDFRLTLPGDIIGVNVLGLMAHTEIIVQTWTHGRNSVTDNVAACTRATGHDCARPVPTRRVPSHALRFL